MAAIDSTDTAGVERSLPAGTDLTDLLTLELVRNGSIELSERNPGAIREAQDRLPYGMNVYVPALPGRSVLESLDRLRHIREAGFDPVPHIAARRIQSREELKTFLQRAVEESSVHRVMLIGGDTDIVSGPYRDVLGVLQDGLVQEAGIREIGLAGHPEGHPRIPSGVMKQALADKLALAAKTGLGSYLVTQFSFAPNRVIDYCAAIARAYPEVPVYVGMAGPTNTLKLLKYARLCGVSASLRALVAMGFKAARLVTHTDPSDQLAALARYCTVRESCNVIGVHLYSFGGFIEAAEWMRGRLSNESAV